MLRAAMLAILLAMSSAAAAGDANLDRWFENELLPFLGRQLAEHPRFKGETLMFVVLDDSAPAAISNALELSLRDRMLAAALQNGGIRIAWKQGGADRPGTGRVSGGPVDCSRDAVHYYVGLDLSRRFNGDFEVNVRALDLEDMSWVSGFAKTWRGKLNRDQRQALRETEVDESFLGARDVPFTLAQADLLAEHLAHELSCGLLRQSAGEYRVPARSATGGTGELDATVELIRHNITAHWAFDVTQDAEQANAELSGKAHRIDGPLHQYWLSITPSGTDEDLTTLSASAYVILPTAGEPPNRRAVAVPRTQPEASAAVSRARPARTPASLDIARTGTLLGPLRIVDPPTARHCGPGSAFLRTSGWSDNRHCSLLETQAHGDTVVFFLEFQPQIGLVRLGGGDCRRRTRAMIARSGDRLRFPIAWFPVETGRLHKADEWRIEPVRDTYYVVAIADGRSARRMANHIDALPARCGEASRPGLTDTALRDWLDDFSLLAAQSAGDIDWRALERKDVF